MGRPLLLAALALACLALARTARCVVTPAQLRGEAPRCHLQVPGSCLFSMLDPVQHRNQQARLCPLRRFCRPLLCADAAADDKVKRAVPSTICEYWPPGTAAAQALLVHAGGAEPARCVEGGREGSGVEGAPRRGASARRMLLASSSQDSAYTLTGSLTSTSALQEYGHSTLSELSFCSYDCLLNVHLY